MNNILTTAMLPQLDDLVATFEALDKLKQHSDYSDIPSSVASEFIIASMAAIHRIAGIESPYYVQTKAAIEKLNDYYPQLRIPHVAGAIKALRSAVQSGYLTSLEQLVHANLFSDFLEMAQYLLSEGYKDPAAVLGGSVLEEHLRQLCGRHNISTEVTDAKGTYPKKADSLNADLARSNIYSKLDQKSITAWLDLRNKAAHGKYSEYNHQQVEFLLNSVREFITRNPA